MPTSVNILTYILEDDTEVHNIITEMMRENGVENIHLFEDPTKFLNALSADVSICVIDHFLTGGINGIDVIRAIKEKNEYSYVIIMSGQDDFKVGVMYLNEGADKYIYKNWSDTEVSAMIPEWEKSRKPNYLDVLVKYLKAGFQEAQRRVRLVKLIDSQLAKTDDLCQKNL